MSRFEKMSVWLTSAAVAVSGFGYMWTKYFTESADPFSVIGHPLEPWFLRVHIVAAPLFVFAIGLIAGRHIWSHLKNRVRLGRRSGLTIVGVLVPMVVSGYLLQVITSLGWIAALAVSHIASGVLFTGGLVVHQYMIGRWRRNTAAAAIARATVPESPDSVELNGAVGEEPDDRLLEPAEPALV